MSLLAQNVNDIFKPVVPPSPVVAIGPGAVGISNFLSNIINIIFIVAGLVFVFVIILSSVQWITSGGDKENIAKARSRLTSAFIGLLLLSLSFTIFKIFGGITGFKFFD